MSARPFTIETSIHELSPGGQGVAIHEIDGERRAVFVSGVARGEKVRIEVDPSRRPARGRLLEVLEASASRTTPPCEHVKRCGGCDWMHLDAGAQAREHAAIVERLLGFPVESHGAVRELGYRTRARVHVEAKRGRVNVGMFAKGSHDPAPVDACVVLDPNLDRARSSLAGWLEGANGRGEARLSLGRPRDALSHPPIPRPPIPRPPIPRPPVLELTFDGDLPPAVYGRLEQAVLGGDLAGARIGSGPPQGAPRGSGRHVGTGAPATIGDPRPFIVGADGELLELAPGGFSQATEEGNRVLAQRVAEVVSALPAGPCVELHAGAGNFTVLLARERDVVSVEDHASACAAARANLAARGLTSGTERKIRVVHGDANAFPIPKGTRVVVLDPPREGARAICEALAARKARATGPAIVYVACDPPTLARDVKILTAAGWAIRKVETFEMFPQTSHVETLVVLEPGTSTPHVGAGDRRDAP